MPFRVRAVSVHNGGNCHLLSLIVSEAAIYVDDYIELLSNSLSTVSATIIRSADSGSAYRGSNPWGAAKKNAIASNFLQQ